MEPTENLYTVNEDFYRRWFDLIRMLFLNTLPGEKLKEEYKRICARQSERGVLWLATAAERLDLSEFEQFAVLLSFAAQSDAETARLCRESSTPQAHGTPDVLLAISLFGKISSQALLCLNFSSGFNCLTVGDVSGINSPLRLTDAAIRVLNGYVPEIKGCSCKIYESLPPILHDEDLQEKLKCLLENAASSSPVVIQLTGDKGCGRAYQMQRLSGQSNIPLILIDVRQLPHDNQELDEMLKDLYLMLVMAPSIVCLCEYEDVPELRRFVRELQNSASFLAVTTKKAVTLPDFKQDTLVVHFEVPALTRTKRKEIWENTFAENEIDVPFDIRPIVNQYNLTTGIIQKTVCELKRRQDIGFDCGETALREIIESVAHQNIQNGLAKLIRPKFGWDDIILPEALIGRLREICARLTCADLVMEKWGFADKYPYGSGVSILFYGAPGTGKTMAAHVIANELKTPLYYVDFSNMIDKYIGETEKHILELFSQAKQSSAILFFDEADALFAKRSGVSDATDRYANAQTACLLQCIEDYDGIVILATNMLANFDEAFKRRIRYFLRFHHPDEPARKLIWQSVFPKDAPLAEDVDFAMLARTELSAGAIKNIALTAAFLAAEDGEIKLSHLNRALRIEMEKDGQTGELEIWEI